MGGFGCDELVLYGIRVLPRNSPRHGDGPHWCRYAGSWDCVARIVRYEGAGGLYKGLTPYLIHVMPNICLVFLTYEYMVNR